MYFVYSNWYIVMAVLLVAIIALVVTFIMMDKKDKVLIEEFVKNSTSEETQSSDETVVKETDSENESVDKE